MIRIISILVIASVFVLGLLSFNQDANAATITLDATSCPTYGGTWDGPTSTCTISSSGNVIAATDELVIPSGTTLVISNTSSIGITNSGTLTNSGTITVSNSGDSVGIFNSGGTITNNSGGQITVSNTSSSTSNSTGIFNSGTLTNSGTITVSNTGGIGINNNSGRTLTNSGTITVSNTGGTGINNAGTLNNNLGGTIANNGSITNTSGSTISNGGTINNNSGGTINNNSGGIITNSGTINNYCGGTLTGTIPGTVNEILCVPTLVSPAYASTSSTSTPTFTWQDSNELRTNIKYEWQIAKFSDPNTPVQTATPLSTASYTATSLLADTYVWKVRAVNADVPSGHTVVPSAFTLGFTLTVLQVATTTSLSSNHNPSLSGQSVVFTATVSVVAPGSGTPTGTVTFYDGTTSLGTGTLSGGIATFSTSSLSAGSHTITASYGGDGTFNPSTSSAITQTVSTLTVTGLPCSTVTTDAAGNTIITGTDCSGKVLTQITLPPGTTYTGSVSVDYATSGANSKSQISGVTVPYPPGKSVRTTSNPGSNKVCIIDSPASVSLGSVSCKTDLSQSKVVLDCSSAGTTTTISGFPSGTPDPRTYTCTKSNVGGQDYLKVDGLAFSAMVIDGTPPTISFVGGINTGDSFLFGSVPAAPTCSTTDDLSGIDGSCTVTGYGTTAGDHTLIATAKDGSGNVGTATFTYHVLSWSISGFYQPVDMPPIVNTIKNGATAPMKFNVYKGTTSLTDPSIATFYQKQVSCTTGTVTDDLTVTTTGGTVLLYDTTGGQFILNWQSTKMPGNCYDITVTTLDGSAITAHFKLK